MASDRQSSSSKITLNPKENLSNHNRSSFFPITRHKLNSQNYLQLSQSIIMFVCGKEKDDYLTGVVEALHKEDPKFKTWKSENMVMSRMINFMNNKIGENFMFWDTKEIWDATRETYFDNENTVELFKVKSILHHFWQSDLSVTQYYNTLTRHWQQLDMFEEVSLNVLKITTYTRKFWEGKNIQVFVGSNKNLDEVRGRVLAIKPLPSIQEVFSKIRWEETRKRSCWVTKTIPPQ